MNKEIFTSMELDAIGEVMNISLGSSATAISNLLEHRVTITSPEISVVNVEDFEIVALEPALGVEIKYVAGLKGSNIMLLKTRDVKVIVDILTGEEPSLDVSSADIEMDEIMTSAMCEVMNQMMGAAATALSTFLNKVVNISTPRTFIASQEDSQVREWLPTTSGPIVVTSFALNIESVVRSEFMSVMSIELAREMVTELNLEELDLDIGQTKTDNTPAAESFNATAAPTMNAPQNPPMQMDPSMQQPVQPMQQPMHTDPSMQQPMYMDPATMQQTMQPNAAGVPPQQMPYGAYPPPQYMPPYGWSPQQPYPNMMYPEPKVISSQPPITFTGDAKEVLGEEQAQNLDLIMNVPLKVSVEIGRTQKKVQDILALTKGSLVILDKLAGDQVDLFVNGKCIGRGDVVVVDDNFGIRVSEILRKPDMSDLAKP